MNVIQRKMIVDDCEKIIEGVGEDFKKLDGKTVLITGANGMLASFFVDTITLLNEKYLKNPCKIIAMIRSELKADSRLGYLHNNPYVIFRKQDVSQDFEINEKVDYIIHAASKASPREYLVNPLDTINTNLKGLINFLEYSKENKIHSFLYFSSSEIYGNPEKDFIPTAEEYPGKVLCTNPRACYTETKRFCETILTTYVKQYEIPAKIVRPWHVFGLGMNINDSRVIGNFIRDGINNRNIEILSDGLATRSFCYMVDAHVGFWKVLFSEFNGEAFNIGNGDQEITIRDLAKLMCSLFDNRISYSFKDEKIDYLQNSPDRCCPETAKAKKLLGHEPKERLEVWLKRMIEFYSIY